MTFSRLLQGVQNNVTFLSLISHCLKGPKSNTTGKFSKSDQKFDSVRAKLVQASKPDTETT